MLECKLQFAKDFFDEQKSSIHDYQVRSSEYMVF